MFDYLGVKLRLTNGRKTPIRPRGINGSQYKPHFRVNAKGEYLGVAFVDGPDTLEPGDEGEITVALLYVDTGVDYSSLQIGTAVEVMEGHTIVATGTILRRFQDARHWRTYLGTA